MGTSLGLSQFLCCELATYRRKYSCYKQRHSLLLPQLLVPLEVRHPTHGPNWRSCRWEVSTQGDTVPLGSGDGLLLLACACSESYSRGWVRARTCAAIGRSPFVRQCPSICSRVYSPATFTVLPTQLLGKLGVLRGKN